MHSQDCDSATVQKVIKCVTNVCVCVSQQYLNTCNQFFILQEVQLKGVFTKNEDIFIYSTTSGSKPLVSLFC